MWTYVFYATCLRDVWVIVMPIQINLDKTVEDRAEGIQVQIMALVFSANLIYLGKLQNLPR